MTHQQHIFHFLLRSQAIAVCFHIVCDINDTKVVKFWVNADISPRRLDVGQKIDYCCRHYVDTTWSSILTTVTGVHGDSTTYFMSLNELRASDIALSPFWQVLRRFPKFEARWLPGLASFWASLEVITLDQAATVVLLCPICFSTRLLPLQL